MTSSHLTLVPDPSSDSHAQQRGPGIAKRQTPDLRTHTVGETIRGMRHTLGIRRCDLARDLGISVSTLARWERDEIQIDRAEAMKLMLSRAIGS